MPNRDLVVIGASAGGIEALQQICREFPADLQAAVLVVVHMSPQSGTMLARILTRAGRLPASFPADGDLIKRGHIYIAPADKHLIVEGDRLRVIQGPRENRHRPAIDPTFRSAARSYGRRAIGVVLTGSLDDGTSGLMVICAAGGQAVVQAPESALFPSMPLNALKRVPDAIVAPVDKIATTIQKLVSEELPHVPGAQVIQMEKSAHEVAAAEYHMPEVEDEIKSSDPSQFACPECGGVLWEINQDGFLRFRCRVGHAYTAMNLQAEERHAIESALWAALRALEESASLYRRMSRRTVGYDRSRDVFAERADTADENSKLLRQFLVRLGAQDGADVGEAAHEA